MSDPIDELDDLLDEADDNQEDDVTEPDETVGDPADDPVVVDDEDDAGVGDIDDVLVDDDDLDIDDVLEDDDDLDIDDTLPDDFDEDDWWETGDDDEVEVPVDPVEEDPEVPLPPKVRDVHLAHLEASLDSYVSDLRTSMMNRLHALYVARNGLGEITNDTFNGLGLHNLEAFSKILVDDLNTRAEQLYTGYVHRFYLPKYRKGMKIINVRHSESRVYEVASTPNRNALNKAGGFVYTLVNVNTGLQESFPASIVEGISFRIYDKNNLPEKDKIPEHQIITGCCTGNRLPRGVRPSVPSESEPTQSCSTTRPSRNRRRRGNSATVQIKVFKD